MTNTLEKCTEIVQDTYLPPASIDEKLGTLEEKPIQPTPNVFKFTFYYLLQVDGDTEFRLTAKSARKKGVKAEFTPAGWIYQRKEDAEEIAKRWTQGKRKINVIRWFDPEINSLLDKIWNGSKDEAKIAKKQIRLEIDKYIHNKKKQEIEMQCYQAGLHHSWLHSSSLLDEDMSENDKKIHAYYKPLWDKTIGEKEEIVLKESDLSKEVEDLQEAIQSEPSKQISELIKSLQKNEIGDAEIFVNLFKDKYVFDPSEGTNGSFYLWNGTSWALDIRKERYKDFDAVADAYLNASKDNKLEKEVSQTLSDRAQKLRTNNRRRNVLETVTAHISFNGVWDYVPKLLPCANGVIDLTTGEFSPSRPEQFIRKVCPIKYNQSAKCPKFIQFLHDISLGVIEWIKFLQRLIGYAVLGVPLEEIIIYLYGLSGRNGKGTLMKVLQYILGLLARTFPPGMVLLQKNPPSSSSPSPELANLQGVRLAVFSEIPEKAQIDSAKVKNLSGRDKISCRRLFSNIDLQIEPTHTMFLQTNYKPKASADDHALWSRNILVPFNASFVRDPKKDNERPLKENLKEELLEEAEGILLWILEGVREYQSIGLKIPEFIRKEIENYRKENDGIGRFLEEMCIQAPELSAPKNKMESAIKEFCKDSGCEIPTRNEISSYLKARFQESKTNKGHFWRGVKIVDEREFQHLNED